MVGQVVHWLARNLHMTKELVVLVMSMIPMLELRGGFATAALFNINLWKAIILCIIGNIIPIPFILWLATPIFTRMKKTKWFIPIVEKLEKKSIGKSEKIQKYEFWGLLIFVGIPIWGTGAWIGALIAAFLGIDIKKASFAILGGIVMATMIMCIIMYFIPWLAVTIF